MIDGGKLVPVVPAVPIDGGNVVPIIQGHGSQRPRWCRVVPAVPAVPHRRREAVADHPGPRVATAAVVLPMIDAGKLLPIIQGHGPRLATAAVVPVVPIDRGNVVPRLDSRECRADHRPGCAVPVPALATAAVVPVVPSRADHRPCRGPALRREAGARGARADRRREGGAAPRQPGTSCRPCRSSTLPRSCPTAGSCCRSSTWLRGARRAGRVDHRPCRGRALRREAGARGADRRREAVADHPGPRLATAAVVPVVPAAPRQPGSCCRSSRATARNGRGGARRVDRRREGGADHRPGCAVRACCR